VLFRSQKDIDALKHWGVAYVITDGTRLPEITAAAAGHEATGETQGQGFTGSRELHLRYTELVDRLTEVFDKIKNKEPIGSKAVDQIAQGAIALVRDERDPVILSILGAQPSIQSLAHSGVDSAILSTVIGIQIGLPPYKLSYLSEGALLHDTGMLRVPDSIIKKEEQLTEDELQKIHAHPLLSYRIITKELLYSDDVGLIGLQHHERWDGEGYPRKTAGASIDELARIVSAVDAFDAMVSDKPYRDSMIGYAAMKALLSDNSRRFDPDILKAFIKSLGIYPLGSTVLLNNAAIARVIATHPDAPLRPKLRVIIDEYGKKYEQNEGDAVDLLMEKSLFIARALDPKELADQQTG
jgi:HD-GYP domain-containing protein (c-di-GMP phosphodiesterase class II)